MDIPPVQKDIQEEEIMRITVAQAVLLVIPTLVVDGMIL